MLSLPYVTFRYVMLVRLHYGPFLLPTSEVGEYSIPLGNWICGPTRKFCVPLSLPFFQLPFSFLPRLIYLRWFYIPDRIEGRKSTRYASLLFPSPLALSPLLSPLPYPSSVLYLLSRAQYFFLLVLNCLAQIGYRVVAPFWERKCPLPSSLLLSFPSPPPSPPLPYPPSPT
jgi:hypothetical protein